MDSVDMLNIYSIKMKPILNGQAMSINIFCNDFNHIEYELGGPKQHSKTYLKQLRSLATEQPRKLTAVIWYLLSQKYPLNHPADWYRCESHWLTPLESFHEQPVDCPGKDSNTNTSLIRISQCNESFQLCSTLPTSFFVPKDLQDVTLINKMSTVIKDRRVPIISYCCPIDYRRHFVMRCAGFDQQSSVSKILNKIVKPLVRIDVGQLMVSQAKLESAHRKLRAACQPSPKHQSSQQNHTTGGRQHQQTSIPMTAMTNSASPTSSKSSSNSGSSSLSGNKKDDDVKFLSKIGRWLFVISQTLKLAKSTARTVLKDSSVLLVEHDDRHWNCVISSLVQILLEPHTRTIAGFESLVSKEWIYLCGHASRGLHNCNQTNLLFILFLDCVYQIYSQNNRRFEFTSEYLKFMFECQFKTVTAQSSSPLDNYIPSSNNHQQQRVYTSSESSSADNFKMLNPFYTPPEHCSSNHDRAAGQNDKINNSNNNSAAAALSNSNSWTHGGLNSNTNSKNVPKTSVNVQSIDSRQRQQASQAPALELSDHIADMRLWSEVYLRWQSNRSYCCTDEYLYFCSC